MQIPGGWLASKFGGKRVIGTSMLLSSVITLLMPVLARSNVYLVVIARAILGLCMVSIKHKTHLSEYLNAATRVCTCVYVLFLLCFLKDGVIPSLVIIVTPD